MSPVGLVKIADKRPSLLMFMPSCLRRSFYLVQDNDRCPSKEAVPAHSCLSGRRSIFHADSPVKGKEREGGSGRKCGPLPSNLILFSTKHAGGNDIVADYFEQQWISHCSTLLTLACFQIPSACTSAGR